MATETEHLHLIRPDPDDYYDITQFNRNMDILDQWIGSVRNRISYILMASVSDGDLAIAPEDGRTEPEDGISCLICLPEELAADSLLAFSGGTAYPLYLPSGKPVTQGIAAAGAYIHVVFNQNLGRWYLIGGSGSGSGFAGVFIQESEPAVNDCVWIKTDTSTQTNEIILECDNNTEAYKYFVEIDGVDKGIENVVDSDDQLTDGTYRFQIL